MVFGQKGILQAKEIEGIAYWYTIEPTEMVTLLEYQIKLDKIKLWADIDSNSVELQQILVMISFFGDIEPFKYHSYRTLSHHQSSVSNYLCLSIHLPTCLFHVWTQHEYNVSNVLHEMLYALIIKLECNKVRLLSHGKV